MTLLRVCIFSILLGFSFGCSSHPIEGLWRSENKLGNGKRNELAVNADLTGDAVIYATPAGDPNSWTKFRFNFVGEEVDDGFRVDLQMECQSGGCSGNDFKMKCNVIELEDETEVERLDCKGTGNWVGYPFDWERVFE